MALGIKRLVKSTLEKARGARVRAGTGFHSDILNPFLSLLKQLHFDPAHIVDVGANRGDWTRAAVQYFPDTHYTLVEPQGHLKAHIQDLLEDGYKLDWISAGVAELATWLSRLPPEMIAAHSL